MDETRWVKIHSWHIVELDPAGDEEGSTVCGRPIPAGSEVLDDFVGNEKTCESCLRIEVED